MNRLAIIILHVLASIFLITCKDGLPGPAGKDGLSGINKLNGTISGFAYLNDYLNNRLQEHAGITVTLSDGDSLLLNTTTNTQGKFSFKDVKTGSYKLSFTKANFLNNTNPIIDFVGGNLPNYIGSFNLNSSSLATILGITIDSSWIDYYNPNQPHFLFSFNLWAIPAAQLGIPVRIFCGKDRNINANNYLHTDVYLTNGNQYSQINPIGNVSLNSSEFSNSDSVCFIAYGTILCPYSQISGYSYCDNLTLQDGSKEYPGLGQPSAVICKAKPQ